MLIYDNEYQAKENQNWTKDEIELQHIYVQKLLSQWKAYHALLVSGINRSPIAHEFANDNVLSIETSYV